jgi:hypothetical protein
MSTNSKSAHASPSRNRSLEEGNRIKNRKGMETMWPDGRKRWMGSVRLTGVIRRHRVSTLRPRGLNWNCWGRTPASRGRVLMGIGPRVCWLWMS